ncbi:MAG: hypothetical protein JXD23_01135 [Spirochaetales bacterium]|nr:hypothetical protein [Spirochaetales bacterium]
MNARWLIVLGLLLLAVSCEPFLFSSFPGYLADATAVADLSGTLAGLQVDQFDFFVLNNQVNEYAFVLAKLYDGNRNLYVYTSDLSLVMSLTDSHSGFKFGERHFVDTGMNFVIGECYLPYNFTPTSTPSSISNSLFGSDSGGCVLVPGGTAVNVLMQTEYSNLRYAIYSDWSSSPPESSAPISPAGGGNFDLEYTGRLFNAPLASPPASPEPVSILAFRDRSNWPEQGYAVVYADYGGYPDFALPPILSESAGRQVFSLGNLHGDNNSVFATVDGIVVRNADQTMRLIGWDRQVKALTRDNGASGQVLIDFSPADYYYVFDPNNQKLYKARDWWQTN